MEKPEKIPKISEDTEKKGESSAEDAIVFPSLPDELETWDGGELFAHIGEDDAPVDEEMIFVDKNCYLVDGSDGVIDFMVADSTISASLSAMLANGDMGNPETFCKDHEIPMVRDVEVLLRGDVEDIRNLDDLSALHIAFDRGGEDKTLKLGKGWEKAAIVPENSGFATQTWTYASEDGATAIILETTLEVYLEADAAMRTARNILYDGNA